METAITSPLKKCKKCGRGKPPSAYRTGRSSSTRAICSTCRQTKKRDRDPEAFNRKVRERRKRSPQKYLCQDSKKSDKKHGRQGNDMTADFVLSVIKKPCTYCGRSAERMTLDRMDNRVAHTMSNVVSCCLRCNHIRNDMPFDVWMKMVPSVRNMTEEGAFSGWRE